MPEGWSVTLAEWYVKWRGLTLSDQCMKELFEVLKVRDDDEIKQGVVDVSKNTKKKGG